MTERYYDVEKYYIIEPRTKGQITAFFMAIAFFFGILTGSFMFVAFKNIDIVGLIGGLGALILIIFSSFFLKKKTTEWRVVVDERRGNKK